MSLGRDCIIVPFSGGLDSTGILVDALAHAQQVVALAIKLQTRLGRADVEFVCREDVLTHLSIRHPQLTIHRMAIDVREFTDFEDSAFWLYMTGVLLRQFAHLDVGIAWGMNEVGHERYATNGWANGAYMPRSVAKISAGFGADASRFVIDPPPHLTMTKVQVAEMIGSTLLDKTWSCRHPDYRDGIIEPCRKCHACRRRRELGIPHRTVEVAHVLRARNFA